MLIKFDASTKELQFIEKQVSKEEIAEMQRTQKEYEEWLKNQPPTQEEIIQQQLDDINLIIADIIGGVF